MKAAPPSWRVRAATVPPWPGRSRGPGPLPPRRARALPPRARSAAPSACGMLARWRATEVFSWWRPALAAALLPAPAAAQERLRLGAPPVRATGVAIPLRGDRRRPRRQGRARAPDAPRLDRRPPRDRRREGRARGFRYRPATLARRYRFRATTATSAAQSRHRPQPRRHPRRLRRREPRRRRRHRHGGTGATWPWSGVAPILRRADVAFGNLECAVSYRGAPIPKEYNFRGSPRALRKIVRYTGIDAFNLANNHTGDFGTAALLDTLRHVRATGARAVGAGRNLAEAQRPRFVRRLGLRIAFVGFSDINPASFVAGPAKPGTAFASPAAIRSGVRAARRSGGRRRRHLPLGRRARALPRRPPARLRRGRARRRRRRGDRRAPACPPADPALRPPRRRLQPRQLRVGGGRSGLVEHGDPPPQALHARRRGLAPPARPDRQHPPDAARLSSHRPGRLARSRRNESSEPTPSSHGSRVLIQRHSDAGVSESYVRPQNRRWVNLRAS